MSDQLNIIITGASKGIGYETALYFAKQGNCRVFAVSRDKVRLEKLVQEASKPGAGEIISVPMDLSTGDFSSLHATLKTYGASHIDILIHNAGLLINKPFMELTQGEWKEIYQVNVFSVVQLTRELLPRMGSDRSTHIVTISSMGGVNGTSKFAGLSAYSSSKGALITLTECLSEELRGQNIRVNSLALGSVQTEMLEKAFPGYVAPLKSEEMGSFVGWFSEHGGRFFNGKTLPVSSSTP